MDWNRSCLTRRNGGSTGFEVWVGSSASLFLKQLQREGPAWAGAAALLILSLLSLVGYGREAWLRHTGYGIAGYAVVATI